MRIVAIINQKGGCGKTTTSINLAACLARLGQKTLLVDMDPQGHCGVGLAVPEEQIERTILDALIESTDGRVASMEELTWQIATDFDLAPSNIKLAGFEQLFAGRTGREDRLAKALESVRSKYEWAILDCPPSVGLLTFNALKCCDEAIVPVETGYFSLHGLTKMMETLEVMRKQCGRDIMVRVLPTLYDTRTKLAREVLSELRSKFRDYLMESTVNFNTKLKEAASFGQPITEYDPGSRGYKDFVNLARELMGHRPVDVEPMPVESSGLMSRPAELVQRAKQLAQLTNFQFGRGTIPTQSIAQPAPAPQPGPAPVTAPRLSNVEARPVGGQVASEKVTLDHISPPPVQTTASDIKGSDPLTSSLSAIGIKGSDPFLSNGSAASVPLMRAQVPQKSTDQKLQEFYGVKKVGDDVVFAVKFEDAKKVLVAGDFNNWMPVSTPMSSGMRPGMWVARLPLPPGRYRYRLVVDGKWMTDPNNKYVEVNEYGELNNVVEVAA